MASILDDTILKRVAKARGVKEYTRESLGTITKAELMRIDPNMIVGGFKVKHVSANAIKKGRWRTTEEWRDKLY